MSEEHIKKRRINYSQTIIYAILVGMIILVLGLDNHRDNQREDDRTADIAAAEKGRCVAGIDTRDVLRSIVDAVYDLATGIGQRNPNDPPLTQEQINQYNAFITRLNEFRDDMYAKIKPSDQCKKYVDDDNQKPPTPPIPPLPVPKE